VAVFGLHQGLLVDNINKGKGMFDLSRP